jgi:hypothetical protein
VKVAFLLPELGRSGGAQAVLGHVRRLRGGGVDAELVLTSAPPAAGAEVPVRGLAEAREGRYDVALATWWATVDALWEIDARGRALLVQNVEHRFYRPYELADLVGALSVLCEPLDFICIAGFMRDLLAELRPDARTFLVPVGIDKQAFRPRPRPPRDEGPLRVVVEGQPTLWFKGIADAVAAVRGMREPAELTLAVHQPGTGADLGADRVVGGLSPEEMAALYGAHDVQLKLARFEGLGLAPLEGFHVGLPCVATPYTAHEEYLQHGVNGLVVGFDDLPATSAALDLLARRPELLERLSRGALATAERWPDGERSTAALLDALRAIAEAPGPPADHAHRRRAQRLALELVREHVRQLDGALAWARHELDDARATLDEVNAARDELAAHLKRTQQDLAAATASRAYRLAVALRRLKPGGGR